MAPFVRAPATPDEPVNFEKLLSQVPDHVAKDIIQQLVAHEADRSGFSADVNAFTSTVGGSLYKRRLAQAVPIHPNSIYSQSARKKPSQATLRPIATEPPLIPTVQSPSHPLPPPSQMFTSPYVGQQKGMASNPESSKSGGGNITTNTTSSDGKDSSKPDPTPKPDPKDPQPNSQPPQDRAMPLFLYGNWADPHFLTNLLQNPFPRLQTKPIALQTQTATLAGFAYLSVKSADYTAITPLDRLHAEEASNRITIDYDNPKPVRGILLSGLADAQVAALTKHLGKQYKLQPVDALVHGAAPAPPPIPLDVTGTIKPSYGYSVLRSKPSSPALSSEAAAAASPHPSAAKLTSPSEADLAAISLPPAIPPSARAAERRRRWDAQQSAAYPPNPAVRPLTANAASDTASLASSASSTTTIKPVPPPEPSRPAPAPPAPSAPQARRKPTRAEVEAAVKKALAEREQREAEAKAESKDGQGGEELVHPALRGDGGGGGGDGAGYAGDDDDDYSDDDGFIAWAEGQLAFRRDLHRRANIIRQNLAEKFAAMDLEAERAKEGKGKEHAPGGGEGGKKDKKKGKKKGEEGGEKKEGVEKGEEVNWPVRVQAMSFVWDRPTAQLCATEGVAEARQAAWFEASGRVPRRGGGEGWAGW